VFIEETDIDDLNAAMAATTHNDIKTCMGTSCRARSITLMRPNHNGKNSERKIHLFFWPLGHFPIKTTLHLFIRISAREKK